MNGAKGDEPAKTINAPTKRSTEISGTSHHFFSCLMKRKNSLMIDCLAIIRIFSSVGWHGQAKLSRGLHRTTAAYRTVTLSAVRSPASNSTLRRIPASKSTRVGFFVTMELPMTNASIPVFMNVW